MNGESSYRRFLQGDKDALGTLVERYNKSLVFYLNGILGNVSKAEDAAADAFVSILIKKPRLKNDDEFRAYLFRAGRNRAFDMLRADKRQAEVSEATADTAADTATLEDVFLKSEHEKAVHSAIATLKDDYGEVLKLLYFHGASYKEAALIMRKSEKQITNLAHRAKAALRAALEKEGYEYYENQ